MKRRPLSHAEHPVIIQAIAFVSARGYTLVDTPREFSIRLEKYHEVHGHVVVHFDSWDVSASCTILVKFTYYYILDHSLDGVISVNIFR